MEDCSVLGYIGDLVFSIYGYTDHETDLQSLTYRAWERFFGWGSKIERLFDSGSKNW